MSCAGFVSPLDLECILVNNFSGNWIIFGFLLVIAVIILAARFRMGSAMVGASMVLLGLFFFESMPWIMYTVIIGLGIVLAALIGEMIKR